MKVMRFELPGQPGESRVGFVDLENNQAVECAAVLGRLGVAEPLARAVDIIAYNTEQSGALSQGVGELDRQDAPRWGLDEVVFLPPVEAASLRDFIAFEEHIRAVRFIRGAEIPPAWYKMPVYYKGNYRTLLGHEQALTWPRYSQRMDYELELACVIGKEGTDISEDGAAAHVGGYTVMNDWSARDIQMEEMSVGLGPAKGKDFATSLGPWLVTPDEFNPADARMTARINGEDVVGREHRANPLELRADDRPRIHGRDAVPWGRSRLRHRGRRLRVRAGPVAANGRRGGAGGGGHRRAAQPGDAAGVRGGPFDFPQGERRGLA